MNARVLAGALAAAGLVMAVAGSSSAQMPDPRMMSGQIMPSPELPAGTVTVRIIRQTIMNVVPRVEVELHGAGAVRHETTGADGHAVFSGVPTGARVQAVAVVDGERLQSIEFEVPVSGGIRTILAAGVGVGTMIGGSAAPGAAPGAANATTPPSAAPATAGSLAFAGDTRIAVEFQDDTLTVFYLLDLLNRTAGPVAPKAPLVIDLPPGASGATVLEGGSPLATVSGSRVTIAGPLPAGITQVPVAFRIEHWNATWQLVQTFPLPLETVAMAVQKLGEMQLTGAQVATLRETTLQGTPFIIATGAGLPAGTPLSVTVTGLPHRSDVPLYVTLALAAAVAAWGVWVATSARPRAARDEARRHQLETRRERGLAALAALEGERGGGLITEAAYAERRAVLVQQLEHVYGELDGDGGVPGGDRGLAA